LVTIIQDREADIYEVFYRGSGHRHHLIVRSSFDRTLQEGLSLTEKLAGISVSGFHVISLKTDSRVKRKRSQVRLEIKFCKVNIQKPTSSRMKSCPPYKELYVVEAKESPGNSGKDKIYWRLLTTHPVEDIEKALLIVEWYRCRWYIEQVFRLLKHKGFQIEETELESGSAIRKLTIIMLTAILKIIQMRPVIPG